MSRRYVASMAPALHCDGIVYQVALKNCISVSHCHEGRLLSLRVAMSRVRDLVSCPNGVTLSSRVILYMRGARYIGIQIHCVRRFCAHDYNSAFLNLIGAHVAPMFPNRAIGYYNATLS